VTEQYITFDKAILPVGDLRIRCARSNEVLQLEIQDDVTPLESVRISYLLAFVAAGAASSMLDYDWTGYIDKHRLHRHFTVVK